MARIPVILLLDKARRSANAEREVRVTLALDAALDEADANKPVWVQVAEEGEFNGYAGGAFKFDTAVFAELVSNFKKHPSYRAGADGTGTANVVAWDFNHASEQGATSGSIPISGAPAQGWVRDLAVRMGADNKAELWALTQWLEPARSYIKEGRYQWASVTVVFNAIDPKSGVNVGSLLTSIALTNQPFIEGMTPLAAERRSRAELMNGYYEPAKDAQCALDSMLSLLQLPLTSGVAGVLGQCANIQAWIVSGGAPLGVDLANICGCMRRIFNLPALATTDEIFAEVQRMLGTLLDEQAAAQGVVEPEPEPEVTPPEATPAAAATRTDQMNIALLAKKLGVQPTAEAVMAALEAKLDLVIKLAKALGLAENAADGVILEAAGDARARLAALLKALKIENPDEAIDGIADLMAQAAQLKEVMPELEGLKKKAAAAEEEEVEEDVDEAMASKNYPAELRDALVLERRADKAKFQAKYPRRKAEAAKTSATGVTPQAAPHLQVGLGSTPKGTERAVLTQRDGKVIITPPGRASGGDGTTVTEINLSRHAGANRFQKLCAYVRSTEEGAKLSWDDVCAQAHAILASGAKIVDVAA